jgi:2-methylcitrate dehydratase PrpD
MFDKDMGFKTSTELAKWISDSPEVTDPVALERAQNAFIDTISCILAAAKDETTNRVFRSVKLSGGGACSVVGRPQTLPAEAAALVNGTAAHALDFDDNFMPAVTHASAVLIPALLALGEEIGASGNQLIDAYIIGLQAQSWIGAHMIPAHYAAGWHSTSTVGAIGAAAACIRLLSVDASIALNALSIATSMAGGSKQQFGTMTKPLHAGLAARAGISASRFADSGVEANGDPFEGPWGFFSLHHAEGATSVRSTSNLAIIENGLAQKRFPCCASAHRSLDSIVSLMEEYNIDTNSIFKIETVIPDSNYRNLRFNNPETASEARFSMTYCAAVAALYGKLRLSDFSSEAISRTDVRSFMKRVEMISAGKQSDEGVGIWDYPAVTTIHLKDGRELSQSVQEPVGTIHSPLSLEDRTDKFFECASFLLSTEDAQSLFDCLTRFSEQEVRHVAARIRGLGDTPSTANMNVVVNK